MKTLSSDPSRRYGCIIRVMNALLAVVLTILSFQYIEPKNCYRTCGESLEGKPCSTGGCPIGKQKAGWPLPAFIDAPGGGSPTGGWGLLGPEDIPSFLPLILDVLFYSVLLWLTFSIVQLVRRQAVPLRLILTSLPLNIFIAISLWFFYMIFGHSLPIGRGHSVQVYIDTPTDRGAGLAFFPIVSIPVDELIQNYGNPDDVWLTSEGSTEKPMIRIVLHWDSIGMLAKLPEVADETYVVKEWTHVEMIIFPYEEPVIALDGKPVGEKNISWTGYGNYQP
jgi:hypothetical protein